MRPVAQSLGFLGFLLVTYVASAQTYPAKPIRLLVPFPDLVARSYSQKLAELLAGQGAACRPRIQHHGELPRILWCVSPTGIGYLRPPCP